MEEEMKKYLSFGAGVNSTALLLLLTDQGEDFETIFVNHGGDYPETYEYLGYLRDKGFEITEIIPDVQGCHTILEYCYKYKIIPLKMWRWCTSKFKIRPIYEYIEKPCEMMLGISSDERKRRIIESRDSDIKNIFPLYEAGITRRHCIKIIKDHNLKVPRPSGCFFCPFMTKKNAMELYRNYPELYRKVIDLERNCNKPGYHLKQGIPFDKFAEADVPPLTGLLKK